MAMMSCTECNHEISDRPLAAELRRTGHSSQAKHRLTGLLAAVVVLACVGVAIWLMLPYRVRTSSPG